MAAESEGSVIPPEASDAALLARAAIRDLPADPADGFFRPGCWLHRISGQPLAILGGGRALLLEIAHPVVAAGVAEHSNFRRDPFGRLQRTLAVMRAITFEGRAAGLDAVRAFERAHVPVHGTFERAVGRHAAGASWSAADPDARRWVWATLVAPAVMLYRRFVSDLPPDALAAYYADQCAIARLLGIPADVLPADWPTFEAWFAATLDGDDLCVDDRAREIARAVLDGPLPESDARAVRLFTTALLPERLREAFALEWGPERRAQFAGLEAGVRALRDGVDARAEPR